MASKTIFYYIFLADIILVMLIEPTKYDSALLARGYRLALSLYYILLP